MSNSAAKCPIHESKVLQNVQYTNPRRRQSAPTPIRANSDLHPRRSAPTSLRTVIEKTNSPIYKFKVLQNVQQCCKMSNP